MCTKVKTRGLKQKNTVSFVSAHIENEDEVIETKCETAIKVGFFQIYMI